VAVVFERNYKTQHLQIWDMVNEGSPYFYVELPDGTRMAALNVRNFPLQFAR
uniref:Cwf19-like protein C-terminal domain-containing protein n=1 Tax=Parascaris univalens TaxID=6257 RepID=A0A915B2V6_PARUN